MLRIWCVFSRWQNVCKVPADVMCSGRLFQMRGPATENARVPTVDSLTGGMWRRFELAERRARRPGRSATNTVHVLCYYENELWLHICVSLLSRDVCGCQFRPWSTLTWPPSVLSAALLIAFLPVYFCRLGFSRTRHRNWHRLLWARRNKRIKTIS